MQRNNQKLKSVLKWGFACIFTLFLLFVLAINILFPLKHKAVIQKYSYEFNIPPSLIYSVIWTESKFDSKAVSEAGAIGLMQLMPPTAEWCCLKLGEKYSYEKLFLPDFNIRLGTFYLSYLVEKYGLEDAIIAYNAGEGNLLKWNGEIKFKETKDYIKRINTVKKIYSFKTK